MNLNNSKYNYARKFKAILKYVLFAVPLIMVLVAVLFPIKTTTNTYDGSITNVSDTLSGIYYNQVIRNGNFEDSSYWYNLNSVVSYSDNICNLTATAPAGEIYQRLPVSRIAGHKYYTCADIKLTTAGTYFRLYLGPVVATTSSTTEWQTLGAVYSSTSNVSSFTIDIQDYRSSGWDLVQIRNVQVVDLTLMFGSGNEPTYDEFSVMFPNDYYEYNSGELLMLKTVDTTTTINDTDLIWYTEDTKTLNITLLSPMVEFYSASINSWYESFLTAFELDYDTTSYMYYLVHLPLWIMYVVLLDLLLDIVLLVPCLLHRLVYKYKGDE